MPSVGSGPPARAAQFSAGRDPCVGAAEPGRNRGFRGERAIEGNAAGAEPRQPSLATGGGPRQSSQ